MKRKITVTIEFDDDPIYLEEEDKWLETDALDYAMDVAARIAGEYWGEFQKAEFDGELLFTRDGEAPDAVKQMPKYAWVMESLQ